MSNVRNQNRGNGKLTGYWPVLLALCISFEQSDRVNTTRLMACFFCI